MTYCVVHDDYEGVAVVAAGLAAPVAMAHALGCLSVGSSVRENRRRYLQ
jgi:hypothetical protein